MSNQIIERVKVKPNKIYHAKQLDDNMAVLQEANRFSLSKIIDRYSEDHSLPVNVAEDHAKELVRFLVICAINPDKRYTMLGPVDEF